MTSGLLAGVARHDFAIPDGTPLCGFASRHDGSQGALDPIGARALAVSCDDGAALVVVADLTTLEPASARRLRAQIAESIGIDPVAVVVAVTHTHASPSVDPGMTAPVADEAVIAGIEHVIVQTARTAWASRAPAAMAVASGSIDDVTTNRRRPDGPTDPTVSACRIDLVGGAPLAVLFGYACHPTVLSGENLALSADWPGAARRAVETALPGATALFLQGFCGDCNTGHSAHSSMQVGTAPGRSYADLLRVGERVAAGVLQLVRDPAPEQFRTEIGISTVEIPLSTPVLRASTEKIAEELERAAAPTTPGSVEAALAPVRLRWAERMAADPAPSPDLTVTAHRWGELTIAYAPGEPFSAIARDVRSRTALPHLLMAGYSNGVHGYVPYPASEYARGGYEVTEAHLYYGRPAALPPAAGEEMRDALTTAVTAVATAPPAQRPRTTGP